MYCKKPFNCISVSESLAMPSTLPLIQGFHAYKETTTVRRRRRRRECVRAYTWLLCSDNVAASVGMATIGSSTLLLLLLLLSGPPDATALELGKSLRKMYCVGVYVTSGSICFVFSVTCVLVFDGLKDLG